MPYKVTNNVIDSGDLKRATAWHSPQHTPTIITATSAGWHEDVKNIVLNSISSAQELY